ncbi:MAG: ATP-binding cassette domain-containing protein [Candidatus Thermoplasmatota archaeon]|nr:ATP-binding cassette domain-containing protein [Candidatus Thermoplasmatota archaeon]
MPVIKTENISKKYGEITALQNINLEIEAGDFFGLFGPNGAGKTTLLKILSGSLAQTSGEAYVLGINVNDKLELKRRIGVVPEIEALPSFLTSEEFLMFVCRARNLRFDKIEYLLEFFELEGEENKLIKDLSRGARQKLQIANALIHEPEILFLDEPLSNLDPLHQAKLKNYFKEFVNSGKTIFLCTHVLEVAEKLCSKIGIINNGIIVAIGRVEDLRTHEHENLEQIFQRVILGER